MESDARITIERVTSQTADVLSAIAEDVFDGEMVPEHLKAFLASSAHALFVARAGEEVVGQARGMIHLQPDEAPHLYIDNLGVAPAFKRQGIARRLVDALIAWGNDMGASEVWVLTEPENEEGNAFYRALNFNLRIVHYYGRGGG